MINTYTLVNKDEIFIEAPGSSSKNRIKNNLVWDVNSFLNAKYELYSFEICRKKLKSENCLIVPFAKDRCVVFQRLDSMFINPTILSDDELQYYRRMMDPHGKMDDAVFKEACCLENVDMQYVAIKNIECYIQNGLSFESNSNLSQWIQSSCAVYASMFGAREIRMIVNHDAIKAQLLAIIANHCKKKEDAYMR